MQNLNFKKSDFEVRETLRKRKEDNILFYSTHLNKLTSETGSTKQVFDNDSLEDGYYCCDQTEYRHMEFIDITFGIETAKDEDELIKVTGVNFSYCDFSACCFSNIMFINCSFNGCNFKECYTLELGVLFKHCSFSKQNAGKTAIGDMPSIFDGCALTLKFLNCDISQVVFDKSSFYFSTFESTNAYDAIFVDCNFEIVKIKDCDLRKIKIVNAKFIEFAIEDVNRTSLVNSNTYLGPINFNKNEQREVKYASEAYSAFNELFENNKMPYFSGEYFYLYKRTEYYSLDRLEKSKSLISNITCGYGERPSNSLLTAIILVLFFGTMYMLFGVGTGEGDVSLFTMPLTLQHFILWYHFSLVTFTTTGFGNVVPANGLSVIFSGLEMVSGVVMVGLWVSTLARKMTR
jgi:uncharacterized protein YjbI with pentapeptide repeats